MADIYRARRYQPIWMSGHNLSAAGQQLFDRLASADIDGLDPDDYRLDRIQDALDEARQGSPKAVARAEALLTRSLLDYVRDLHRPANRKQPAMAYIDEGLEPSPPEPRAVLAAASAGQPLGRVTRMHPVYEELRAGYAAWRKEWRDLPDLTVPSGPKLAAGSRGDRVRLLRMRLGLPSGNSFDKTVAEAVSAFNAAHGLRRSPVADARTIALLNEPRSQQEARIRVNLARARELPSIDRGRHILVDAAAQRLYLYEGGTVSDSMKVVVGKPSDPTPMMAAFVRYAALNPYWYVPPDLAADRIAKGVLRQGVGYLKAGGYEVLSGWDDGARPIDPATVDWENVAAGKVDLPVRQVPGPENMMGEMKFMFPNRFGVYLHDTPEKGLFRLADRRRSSGCVRLEDAPRLARWLFGDLPKPSGSDPEEHVPLEEPVPVYITYLTVAPQSGGIAFRDDPYQRDAAMEMRFASAGRNDS